MKTPRILPCLAGLTLLAAGCSEPAAPQPPSGPAAGATGQQQPSQQQTGRQQGPQGPAVVESDKPVAETLLSLRQDEKPIFVAECTKKPQSESMQALGEKLTGLGIKYNQQPQYPNYEYYLAKLIALPRKHGKVWLVYDHRIPKLDKALREGFIAQHTVALEHRCPDGTVVLATNEFTAEGPKRYDLQSITGRSSNVTNIAFTPDDRFMFVTSKHGQIRWFSRTGDAKGVVMRMPIAKKGREGLFSGGESGVIGMALHPEFADNRKLYLNYNWKLADGSRSAILSEWTVDLSAVPEKIEFTDERRLLSIVQTRDNHNAGCLVFGPDGYLYIGVGDGEEGKWTIGRSPAGTLRGKVLRIDVDRRDEGKEYAVPADNPFVGNPEFPPETWAWGFRNPWRLAFVPDGRLIASDIGEDKFEELTFVVKGRHHGWPYFEGLHPRNPWTLDAPVQPPLLPYGRKYGMSVIAGNVYEGESIPELRGKFVFGDHLSGRIWAFDLPPTTEVASMDDVLDIEEVDELTRVLLMLSTITKGPDGELYFGVHTGQVMRLVKGPAHPSETDSGPAAADPEAARGLFGADFTGPEGPAATPPQVALGRRLFLSEALSADGTRSCATCHDLGNHGQDGRAVAAGGRRNTPSIFNAQRQFAQFRDFRVESVEQAVVESLTAHMGHGSSDDAAARLAADAELAAAFAAAFPNVEAPITAANVGVAVGAFVRQLTTGSRWEEFLDGDDAALTEEELVGLQTFLDVGCTTCHLYRGVGGGMAQKLGLIVPWNGPDKGRGLIDDTPGQEYFFKVPAMFNVAETGPWYHDGSMKTLEDAVSDMAKIQLGRDLTGDQVDAIVAFLKSMTGELPEALR